MIMSNKRSLINIENRVWHSNSGKLVWSWTNAIFTKLNYWWNFHYFLFLFWSWAVLLTVDIPSTNFVLNDLDVVNIGIANKDLKFLYLFGAICFYLNRTLALLNMPSLRLTTMNWECWPKKREYNGHINLSHDNRNTWKWSFNICPIFWVWERSRAESTWCSIGLRALSPTGREKEELLLKKRPNSV